jgi:hypothetical protein
MQSNKTILNKLYILEKNKQRGKIMRKKNNVKHRSWRITTAIALVFIISATFASLTVVGESSGGRYLTSLGVENTFLEPIDWNVGDLDSTYQEWDAKTEKTGNLPDQGYVVNPTGLTDPTHSVKSPGFLSGSENFYSFMDHFGATADIYNHGGVGGTHVIVQIGTTVNHDPTAWATYGNGDHGELVEGHGIGVFWDVLKIVDLDGDPINGGNNEEALNIAEVSYREDVNTSFGPVDYQELIYEFYLIGYTSDFRVDWDQCIHATIDTLRVDSIVEEGDYPSIPNINGPSQGIPDTEYDYTFLSTTPDSIDVYYFIDWGDGETEEWIGPYASGEEVTVSHSWSETGTFVVKAKAKDIYDAESGWGKLSVKIPRTRSVSFPFLQQLIEKFPMLQLLFNYSFS